ncbi:tRNA lysidine(34) synthetase TilS [Novosphingobium sp. JCM 18896]|uniref:tRNA lysidine(34) synthetase TilS n=1 Tax=Novosphingobium sp. JCM 18896 TaxID=2989731 RepID=UPI002223AB32|nr:tRNA lysidine(34) synthetase TilS [Novosphingobium sp. JCM 18896]MCW1429581.1 tRNA lysidine(34) synthetase TilS [Novosphingobium sp. JCM 18896]
MADLDPALISRFAEDLGALRREPGKLGIAVSGGPDSLALLLLAKAALPGAIAAATVDHGLRAESAAEAAAVARLCAELGVPHAVLAVTVAEGNVQSEARAARYAALAEWAGVQGLDALLTAHHADDQAETLLLRLNRASGVAGLAGTRARGQVPGSALPLLRPLLGWRKAELEALVAAAGIDAAQDPSNADDRFDRARLRKALQQADWLDVSAVATSAGHLADADAALEWAARREWSECVSTEGLGVTYRPQAPRAIALRVLARIVLQIDGEEPRGGAVARLFDSLLAGQTASIGGLVVRPARGVWTFMKAPARRNPSSPVRGGGSAER